MARVGAEFDIAALALGDLAHQIQTDAHTLGLVMISAPVKPLEYQRLFAFRDAGAVVADLDGAEEGIEDGLDADAAAGGGVFDRIV